MGTHFLTVDNSVALGTGTNNGQYDTFDVLGVSGSLIYTYGDNVYVNGFSNGSGSDTNTTVDLGNATKANQVGDTVSVNLDGDDNYIGGAAGAATLADATVTVNVSGSGGGNTVDLDNTPKGGVIGTTTVNLAGSLNVITLNDDAVNTVTSGPGATISIGTPGDGNTKNGYSSTVNITGGGNSVTGGDAAFTVTSTDGGNDTVTLGNGSNSVSQSGTGDTTTVGSGNNLISAGASNATVTINDTSKASTDNISIGGTGNSVTGSATGSANINVLGTTTIVTFSVISAGNGNDSAQLGGYGNTITFGNGNNNVDLLNANYGNLVSLGNGNNVVNLNNGYADIVALGNGSNTVSGTGDPTGSGNTAYNVGDNSVTATDSAASSNTVNLGSSTGNTITLGNGTDNVTTGGNSAVTAGNGNDTVTIDTVKLLGVVNGNDVITLGTGNDTVNAGAGVNNVISVGGAGGGSDTVKATGTGQTVTMTGSGASSVDKVTVGGSSDVTVTDATVTATGSFDNTTFDLTHDFGSTVNAYGDNDLLEFIKNTTAAVNLNNSSADDEIQVYGNGSAAYTGTLTLNNFNSDNGGFIDLEGLDGKNGSALNSFGAVLANSTITGGGNFQINLDGGGKIVLAATNVVNASEFHFS